jgi:putative ABC transport system ATP-binding protein
MPEPHRPGEPALQGRHLTRTFGAGATETRAVDDASLDLHAGEATVLMGPSGSGKSTLLAILSGLLPPTEGQVTALGQDLWAMSDRQRQEFRLRHCGFVFQGFNLFPAMSARQQLEVVLRLGELTPAPEARRRADELLELLGLADKAELRPAELSGGEKQREALARALIKNPDFLFADEPTSALDWARGSQVVQLLFDAAHERNACVLIVSHDPRLRSGADRVYTLEDGRLREGGDGSQPDDTAPTAREHQSASHEA